MLKICVRFTPNTYHTHAGVNTQKNGSEKICKRKRRSVVRNAARGTDALSSIRTAVLIYEKQKLVLKIGMVLIYYFEKIAVPINFDESKIRTFRTFDAPNRDKSNGRHTCIPTINRSRARAVSMWSQTLESLWPACSSSRVLVCPSVIHRHAQINASARTNNTSAHKHHLNTPQQFA
jgi:hypothetical protein